MAEIKLTKRIKYAEDVYKELTERAGFPADLASDFLNNIPDVDAIEVAHGRWDWKDFYGDGSLILCCSECLGTDGARENANYCPNCGAKMKGKID